VRGETCSKLVQTDREAVLFHHRPQKQETPGRSSRRVETNDAELCALVFRMRVRSELAPQRMFSRLGIVRDRFRRREVPVNDAHQLIPHPIPSHRKHSRIVIPEPIKQQRLVLILIQPTPRNAHPEALTPQPLEPHPPHPALGHRELERNLRAGFRRAHVRLVVFASVESPVAPLAVVEGRDERVVFCTGRRAVRVEVEGGGVVKG